MSRVLSTVLIVAVALFIAGDSSALSPGQRNLIATALDTPSYRFDFRGASALPAWITASGGTNGTVFSSAGLLVSQAAPRFDYNPTTLLPNGLLVEEARTNVVTRSRDLTNAAWTLGATMTSAKDQTGIDGAANSASSITGGLVGSTNTILNLTSVASTARFQTAYVKCLTCTGAINMTMDGGSTWTALSSSNCFDGSHNASAPNTSAYVRCQIPTQTLANPNVGFQIINSGDSVAVDGVQNEAGTFATSVILTAAAAVTRSVDAIKTTSAVSLDPRVMTLLTRNLVGDAASTARALMAVKDASVFNPEIEISTANLVQGNVGNSGGSTVTLAGTVPARSITTVGLAYNAALGYTIVHDGGTPKKFSGSWVAVAPLTAVWIGADPFSGGFFLENGWTQVVALYNTALPDIVLQSKTGLGTP